MKKIFIFLLSLFISVNVFAFDETTMQRYLEIGLSPSVFAGNNGVTFSDVFVENVLIDLPTLAENTGGKGLNFDFLFTLPNFFMSVNLKKTNIRIKTSFGLDGKMTLGLSPALIDVLANGNEERGEEEFDLSPKTKLDLFAYMDIEAQFKVKKLSISVTPSIFFPIIYIDPNSIRLTAGNRIDGTFWFEGKVKDAVAYTCVDIQQALNRNFTVADIFKGIGFDLGASVSYPIFESLNIGGYARIPIVPGRLKYEASLGDQIFKGEFRVGDQSGKAPDMPDLNKLTSSVANKQIIRPLRFGASLLYKPFGNWLWIDAFIGAGAELPFDKNWYCEYRVAATANVYNIVTLSLATQYMRNLFMHEIGITLNARLLEIQTAVSATGSNFKQSFKGTGVGVRFAAIVGF
ncbi:MAG: hypothetical protein IJR49_04610 [Treponema sp.]|nr:hypothetical protein [Treponema sp.]